MHLENAHLLHSPKRDAIMIVNAAQEPLQAIDRTEEAVQAVVGWTLRQKWDGSEKLPPVMRWWSKVKVYLGLDARLHVSTAARETVFVDGKLAVITVEVYAPVKAEPGLFSTAGLWFRTALGV